MSRTIVKVLEVGKVYFCGTHQCDAEIIHLSADGVACRATENCELFWGGEFSEPYTPEQVAEKKAKQEVIDAIERIIRLAGPIKGAVRLYEEGYRKFEIVEGEK